MHDEKLLTDLINYLIKNPSIFIDTKKILRYSNLSQQKINSLFAELEKRQIGQRIYSFAEAIPNIELINHFKFYFYDYEKYFINTIPDLRLDQKGALLEQYFFSEIAHQNHIQIYTFRTTDQIEIDFILKTKMNKYFAVEIKKDQFIYAGDLQGLHFFNKHFAQDLNLLVLHTGSRDNYEGVIQITPIQNGIKLIREAL